MTDIAHIRLHAQQIAKSNFKTAKDLVSWMGAIQAQDYNMAKWAIGLRLQNATIDTVDTAIDKGKIIRTHLLRPTWHFVSSDDLHWLLKLTAPKIKASLKSRHKELELTEKVLAKTNSLLEKNLSGGKHLTREELISLFNKNKIATDENRASHIFLYAELEGLICSGATKNAKQTYALLQERIPEKKNLNREEALALLAKKYFTSHGPASLQDFTWWSGLSITDSKKALEIIKPDLISINIKSETYWLDPSFSKIKKPASSVFLLPAFDEFLISYKNRTASLIAENHKKVISFNGIFWPTIIVNGKVAGLWKRTIKKDKMIIDTECFSELTASSQNLLKKRTAEFRKFLNLPAG